MKIFFIIGCLATILTFVDCWKKVTTVPAPAPPPPIPSGFGNDEPIEIIPLRIGSLQQPLNAPLPVGPPTCVCPGEPDNKHDDSEMKHMKKKLVKNFWNKESNEFKGTQNKMKAVVLKMADSDSSDWNDSAFVTTAWLANYYPHISKTPSLCTFAQMINATVAWENTQKTKALSEAIDQVALSFIDFAMATGDSAIRAAGCTAPVTKYRDNTCYVDGTEYEIDQMWDIDSGVMPCAFKKATNDLYKSTIYSERLMAAVATVSLSHPFQEMLLELNHNMLYKMMELATATSPIPSCCCSGIIDRVNKDYASYGREAFKVAEEVKSKHSKNWEKRLSHKH